MKKTTKLIVIITSLSMLTFSGFIFKEGIYLTYLPYATSNHQKILIKDLLCPAVYSDSKYSSIIATLEFINKNRVDTRYLIKTECFSNLMRPDSQGGYREPISAMSQSEFIRQTLPRDTKILEKYIEKNCGNKEIISGLTHRISFIYQENGQSNNSTIDKLLSSCSSQSQ